jgi:Phage conserved hypothetical protein BR0599/Uncharacterized conserved protein (DUF2163)
MKRLMPSPLTAFLADNPVVHRADLFVIALPTGFAMCVTDGQWDVTIPAGTPGWAGGLTTFSSYLYGNWTRGAITSEASFNCAAYDMDLTLIARPEVAYPGLGIGILNAAFNHLFDGATVWLFTAYMPLGQYGNVSNGIETKWQGTIMKWNPLGRNKVKFECSDPMYMLNVKVPTRLFQSNCSYSFADPRCSLNAENYTVLFNAAAVSTQTTLSGGLKQADGYFTQGVVTCKQGHNVGLSQTVKAYAGGVLTLMAPFLMPVAAGDQFSVIKGCDKTPTTCAATTQANGTAEPQNWEVRFGGDPFIPPPSSAM